VTGNGAGRVALIGLGTVGSALAARLSRAGVPVIGVEADDERVVQGQRRIAEESAGPATTPSGSVPIRYTTRLADIAGADVVVEALPERLPVKVEALREAHRHCGPEAVFATTTSGFSVTAIGAACQRLNRTVGLHLVDPARVGKVVELVDTPVADRAALDRVDALSQRIGLVPVRVRDRVGFLSGEVLMRYLNGAVAMYEQRYASRDDIDDAMRLGCGLPIGPLAQLDLMGLDVAHDTLQALHERTGQRCFVPSPLLATMVRAGLFGRKSGQGFYSYPAQPAAEPALAPLEGGPPPGVGLVGVVGTGVMAKGIAEACVLAGLPTVVVGRSAERATQVLDAVHGSLDGAVRRGRLRADDVDAAMKLLDTTSDLDGIHDCDLVIEAVVEDLDVKRGVFADVDAVLQPGALMATTTSSLSVVACARATSRPGDVVGLHFFNPVRAMRLVELVRTVLTTERSVATAQAFCATLGKHSVHCTDRAGFIVNALLFPYLNQAVRVLEETHARDEIDTVMRDGFGFPLGPLGLLDLIGLDVSLAIQRRLHEEFREPDLEPAPYLEYLVRSGCLGRKNGQGFHAH
jgi:3-hydroxybutyryl-CoA dehydrogenase